MALQVIEGLPSSGTSAVDVATGDCHDPALAVTSDAVHLVWVKDRLVHYARCQDGAWQPPVRLGAGEQPVVAAAPDGTLHCLFASWFLGNCEIYHLTYNGQRWGFPELVSRTPGISRNAAMAFDGDGVGQIVWDDDTPGFPVIYLAGRGQVSWLHEPIPNIDGTLPAIAVAPNGDLHVAWQKRIPAIENGEVTEGAFQVLSCVHSGRTWSLPEYVSEDRSIDAVAPALATGPGGDVHVAWQEKCDGQYVVKYAYRLERGWSRSGVISDSEADARLPRAFANSDGVQVLWVEGGTVKRRTRGTTVDAPWNEIQTVAVDPELSQMAGALSSAGDLHVAWSTYETSDRRVIRYTKIERPQEHKIYFPIVGGGKHRNGTAAG